MTVPKLRFKEFDGNWYSNKIGEISECIVPGRNKPKKFNGDIPWVTTPDLQGNIYVSDTKSDSYISEDEAKNVGSKIVPVNSVIMSCVGDLGLFAINKKRIVINQQLHAFLLDNNKYDSLFILNALSKNKNYIDKVATKTALPYLNKDNCNSIPLYLSTFQEQTKIASFLSAVDEKISQLTQKHQLLSQYKQGMMQKLFSQQLRFKADDGSEFGEWEEIHANELFENYSNKNHDGTLTILAATQDKGIVPRDEIDIDIKSSDASVLSYKVIEKGSFVISLRSFQGGIEYSNYYGICSPAYTILRSIRPIASEFYKNYLKTNDFIQRLSATVVGIRDGKQISYQAFSTLNIDYPPIAEQSKIANFLSAIDQKIEVVAQQIEQAKTWKKGLLQQMFV